MVLQKSISRKGLFCEDFHGISICHLPNGTFFTRYSARRMRGTEIFEDIPSNGSLDLIPRTQELELLISPNAPGESTPTKDPATPVTPL